ncbi:phosphatase PAP2 family protein [Hydrogenimonas sp.]
MITFFTWITYLGKVEVICAFFVTASAILILHKKFNEMIALCVSLFGSSIFVYLAKIFFHRPRPEIALYSESTYSFPSAHATLAISFYAFLGYIAIRKSRSKTLRALVYTIIIALVFLIGFSRIYLGVHYLSDVCGGYFFGMLWAFAAAALLRRLEKNQF